MLTIAYITIANKMKILPVCTILNEKLNSTIMLNLVLLSSSISYSILVPSIRSRKEVLMCKSIPGNQKHMTMDQRILIEKGLDQGNSLRSIAL